MAKGNKKKSNVKKAKSVLDKKPKADIQKARKKKNRNRGANKTFEHGSPSRYGSHAAMLSSWVRPVDEALVICEDERGLYVTEKNRLDSGIADPKRWSIGEHRDRIYSDIEKIVDPSKKNEEEGGSE